MKRYAFRVEVDEEFIGNLARHARVNITAKEAEERVKGPVNSPVLDLSVAIMQAHEGSAEHDTGEINYRAGHIRVRQLEEMVVPDDLPEVQIVALGDLPPELNELLTKLAKALGARNGS